MNYTLANDKLVRQIVKIRDSNEYGYGNCCTCGEYYGFGLHPDQLATGHYIKRTFIYVTWNLKNLHAQCNGCNGGTKGGNKDNEYNDFMVANYTFEEIEQLHQLAQLKPPMGFERDENKRLKQVLEGMK